MNESRFRRFMMQGIMWVILGATIVAAAFVDQAKDRSLAVVLDTAKQFDGFTIRLPKGWRDSDAAGDEEALVTLEDPNFGDILTVSVKKPSLADVFTRMGRGGGRRGSRAPQEDVSIDGQKVKIDMRMLYSPEDGTRGTELSVSRPLDSRGTLSISLATPAFASMGDMSALAREINVIKQVAGSVRIDAPPDAQQ